MAKQKWKPMHWEPAPPPNVAPAAKRWRVPMRLQRMLTGDVTKEEDK